jgi:FkbM family methyltransferase
VFSQRSRHIFLQRLFWNAVGHRLVSRVTRFHRQFDTVVRGFSLISTTNGERWLPTLLEPSPVIIDVGFHDGTSTRELLAIRPMATVYGFDPSRFAKETYEMGMKSDPRVRFNNCAVASRPGVLTLHDYGNMCNSLVKRRELPHTVATTYEVPVITLDDFCESAGLNRVSLLKVDAEGYDLDVLEGGHRMLSSERVDIFVFEFASGWAGTKRYLWEAVDFLRPLPYSLFHLCNGFLRPLQYEVSIDSCTTLSGMYVGISESRLERGGIPVRDYRF